MEQHQLLLLAYGVPPGKIVLENVAEMFTTGVSAISHHKFGNINKKLVRHDTWCFGSITERIYCLM
jgi:uncharacterized membrane protein YfcA